MDLTTLAMVDILKFNQSRKTREWPPVGPFISAAANEPKLLRGVALACELIYENEQRTYQLQQEVRRKEVKAWP